MDTRTESPASSGGSIQHTGTCLGVCTGAAHRFQLLALIGLLLAIPDAASAQRDSGTARSSESRPTPGPARRAVRARDIELRGRVRPQPQQMDAEFRAYVNTPFGRIPVTGRGRLQYTCDGHFSGTMNYSKLIILLARLKDIDLVRSLSGQLLLDRPPKCGSGPERTMFGRVSIDSLDLAGWVRVTDDSIGFRGITWSEENDYHGVVQSVGAENALRLWFTMSSKPHPEPLPPHRSATR